MSSTVSSYYRSNLAYFDFYINNGSDWPDWNTSLYVNFYDASGALRFTATTTSSPKLTKGTDTDGSKYVYVNGINLGSFAYGLAEARIYAEVSGEELTPSPTIVPAFIVVQEEVIPPPSPGEYPTPGELVIGDGGWVTHLIRDWNNDPLLNLSSEEVVCKYWQSIYTEFQPKMIDSDNFVEVGNGEYKVFMTPIEVLIKGPLITIVSPRTAEYDQFPPSIDIVTITQTVSGTCTVTGQLVGFDGIIEVEPQDIVIENVYNPLRTIYGSIAKRTERHKSDSSGRIELTLVRGIKIRVTIAGYGIVKTITIPNQSSADLFTLIDEAIDEFEPN